MKAMASNIHDSHGLTFTLDLQTDPENPSLLINHLNYLASQTKHPRELFVYEVVSLGNGKFRLEFASGFIRKVQMPNGRKEKVIIRDLANDL